MFDVEMSVSVLKDWKKIIIQQVEVRIEVTDIDF